VTGKHASNWTAYLALGGRGIDTGLTYGDAVQEKVATAIAASGLPRSEIFLGTKVPCCPNKFGPWPGAHCTVAEFNGTIAQDVARNTALLGSAPDLTLLHWPCITLEQTLTAWRGLETTLADGHTRAIGVSNFNASLLAKMLPKVNVTPAVNQCGHSIAHHTLNQTAATCKGGYCGGDDGTAAFCATHAIQYSAYTPLGGLSGLDIFKEPTVIAIGKAHNVSAAQVALRWLVQKNITVVTAANDPEYIAQDIDLFSWGELTADEMAQLAALTPPDAAVAGALGEYATLKTDDVDSGGDRVIRCDPTVDSTAILTDALNKSHTSVTLATGLVCITEPLVIDGSTNLTLTLQQGAELQAKRGSQQFGVLLSLNDAAAVTIQGDAAPSAVSVLADPHSPSASELARPTFRMWRQDYANSTLYGHDEHRHALSIHGCSQLTLRNLRLTQSGGDGVYVESVSGAVFSSLTLDQNLRQGMSVISANGLLVKDSVFSNTKGTAPMAGIDFEPNEPRNSLSGIEIRSCRVVRNAGAGVQFALHAFTEKSPSVDILFNQTLIVGPSSPCVKSDPDCFLTKGTSYYRWGILVEAWSPTLPTGSIRFINTTVVDTHGWSSPPVWIEKPTTPTALTVEFTDLTVNMSSKGPAMTVSAVEPRSGGVSATGVVINRQCCAGGGPFLVAKDNGKNQLVNVAVRDVRVALSSNDNKSQAAVECSSSLASDAAQNGVTVTNVTCGVAPLTLKSDDNDDAAIVESVRLDFSGHSRQFDGLGGVSAGGSSRLLRDYPPRLAGEILDYMFKPRFGAAYNVLKVE
jgi:2,5-diketo-D-gluconate reductase A